MYQSRFKWASVFSTLIVLILSGCDASMPEGREQSIVPYALGNSWTYTYTLVAADTSYSYEYTSEVVAVDTLGSCIGYRVSRAFPLSEGVSFFGASGDSVFEGLAPVTGRHPRGYVDEPDLGCPDLVLRFFISHKPQQWQVMLSDLAEFWSVEPMHSTVVTPAGSFTDCFLFHEDQDWEYTVAPGIGVLKMVRTVDVHPERHEEAVLTRYALY